MIDCVYRRMECWDGCGVVAEERDIYLEVLGKYRSRSSGIEKREGEADD